MLDNPENLNHPVSRKIRSYSEASRTSHVGTWKASGVGLSRYSAEHGISRSALSKWIKYYGDKLPEGPFKEVFLKEGTINYHISYVGPMIEIKMPNGCTADTRSQDAGSVTVIRCYYLS
jgi:hypothetical protein